MPRIRALKSLLLALLAIVLVGTLTAGCDAKEAEPPVAENNEIGLTVEGLNYSDTSVGPFYVNDQWAGNALSYAGGRSVATSIGLPKVWRAGLTVTISWSNDALYAKDPKALYSRVVEIPHYNGLQGGTFWVAFLPNDQIKVYASSVGPGHPKFPDKELINPRDYCLIRPACHDKYYPNERVPEMWEVTSPVRMSDPPTEGEKREAMKRIAEDAKEEQKKEAQKP